MTHVEILNMDNMEYQIDRKYDVVFADYVYENLNFEWASK